MSVGGVAPTDTTRIGAIGAGGGARPPPPTPLGASPGDTTGAPIAGVGMCGDITGAATATGGAAGVGCGAAEPGEYGAMPPRDVAFVAFLGASVPFVERATVPANCCFSSCEPQEIQ